MTQAWPFLMLAGGLLAFLFSTRQFPLIWRGLIWLVGAGLIAGAIALAANDPARHGLVRALADVSGRMGNIYESVLFQALRSNSGGVAGFIVPLLDLFLLIGVLLGAIALFTFTPGERLERVVRPAFFVLLGAMIGSVVALAVTAIGFGGHVKPRAFVQLLSDPTDVQDGDTIRMGEESIRIWGLDAPELEQACRGGSDCGRQARDHLVEMLLGKIVYCTVPDEMKGSEPPMESFGRPIMECRFGDTNVAQQMIRDGYAVQYRSSRNVDFGFHREELEAKAEGRGLHASCLLEPRDWRGMNRQQRDSFTAGDSPPDGAATIGLCSPQPA